VSTAREGLGKFVTGHHAYTAPGADGTNVTRQDPGMMASEPAKFYAISANFPEFGTWDNQTDLMVQFSVRYPPNVTCAGAYLKIGAPPMQGADFGSETPFEIMFGPDFCGASRTHLILHRNRTGVSMTQPVPAKSDPKPHLYTALLMANRTYQILIDNTTVASGRLLDHWRFLEPELIPDPTATKPEVTPLLLASPTP
jgi:calreticulin